MKENIGINQRSKDYIMVIDSNGHRVSKSRQVWIDNNREIPKGFFIHHKDGNKKNNNIENLQLVTRSEHGFLHSKKYIPLKEKC